MKKPVKEITRTNKKATSKQAMDKIFKEDRNRDEIEIYTNPLSLHNGKATEDEIAKALMLSQGRESHAAKLLGMQPSSIKQRIKQSDFLQLIKETAIDERLDNAEAALDSLVEKENFAAIQFTLSTLGRERGYVRKDELHTTVTGGVIMLPIVKLDNWEVEAKQYKEIQDKAKEETMKRLLEKLENKSNANDSVYDADFRVATDKEIDNLDGLNLEDDADLVFTDPEDTEWLEAIPDTNPQQQKRKLPILKPKRPDAIQFLQNAKPKDGYRPEHDIYKESDK